jgi:hypothetical protein
MTTQEIPTDTTLEFDTTLAENFPVTGEGTPATLGLLPGSETESPFAEAIRGELDADGEQSQAIAEAFESLRDEDVDMTLAELITEMLSPQPRCHYGPLASIRLAPRCAG